MACLTQKDEQGKEQTLPPNLLAWLMPHAVKKTPIRGVNWRKDFDAVKAAAGWGTKSDKKPNLEPWTQDIMRQYGMSLEEAEAADRREYTEVSQLFEPGERTLEPSGLQWSRRPWSLGSAQR